MTEHRWSKFWWQDWQADQALRSCSLPARGLWIDMLCIAHSGTPRGHVTINGQPVSPKRLATLAGTSEKECTKLLAELEEAGVFSRTDAGVIYSRRMVRDTEQADAGREAVGKRWGKERNPITPPNRGATVGPSSLEAEAEAEAEREERKTPSSEGVRARRVRGERLPDDWQPSDPDLPARRGHNPGDVLAKFVAHYRKATGAKGISADWDASWALWCAREAQHQHARPPLHTLPQAEQDRRILAAVGLKFDDPPTVQTLRIAQ